LASASIAFLLLTVFGIVEALQQLTFTNQSTPSNGSNVIDRLSNQSVQNSNSSNESDEIYSQSLEITTKSTCDSMSMN
jgi:hypothetical protein